MQSYDDAVRGHTLHSGPNRAWSCHNLLVVLCQLSEMGHASFIRSVIESPLNNFPEVLLLGMAHVNVGDIRNDLDFLFCFLYGLLFINQTMTGRLHIISSKTRWHLLCYQWLLKGLLQVVYYTLFGMLIKTCCYVDL